MSDSKDDTRSVKRMRVGQREKLNNIHKKQDKKPEPVIVSEDEWVKARLTLLEREKELTRHYDEVVKARQQMPWVEVTKDYVFQSGTGPVKLIDLFDKDKNELYLYHLMFEPEKDEPCPGCSLICDNLHGSLDNMLTRCSVVAVGKAPIAKLLALVKIKEWDGLRVVSSYGNTFNVDYAVEQTAEEKASNKPIAAHQFGLGTPHISNQLPAVSVFVKHQGKVYRSYTSYMRGLDTQFGITEKLDLLPFGRDGFQELHKEKLPTFIERQKQRAQSCGTAATDAQACTTSGKSCCATSKH